jgi:hypothetical protein
MGDGYLPEASTSLASGSYPLIDHQRLPSQYHPAYAAAFQQMTIPCTIQHYPYPYLYQSQCYYRPTNMMLFNNPPYIPHQSWNDLDFMGQLPPSICQPAILPTCAVDAYTGVNYSPASFSHTGNDSIQPECLASWLDNDAPPLDFSVSQATRETKLHRVVLPNCSYCRQGISRLPSHRQILPASKPLYMGATRYIPLGVLQNRKSQKGLGTAPQHELSGN